MSVIEQYLAEGEATERLGALLADCSPPGTLIYMYGDLGAGKTTLLMRELRGRDFEDTFRDAYGVGTGAAEGQWLRWVNRRLGWVPALTSDTAFWLLITLLFLAAIVVRRRRSRLVRERWEREDAEAETRGGEPLG